MQLPCSFLEGQDRVAHTPLPLASPLVLGSSVVAPGWLAPSLHDTLSVNEIQDLVMLGKDRQESRRLVCSLLEQKPWRFSTFYPNWQTFKSKQHKTDGGLTSLRSTNGHFLFLFANGVPDSCRAIKCLSWSGAPVRM